MAKVHSHAHLMISSCSQIFELKFTFCSLTLVFRFLGWVWIIRKYQCERFTWHFKFHLYLLNPLWNPGVTPSIYPFYRGGRRWVTQLSVCLRARRWARGWAGGAPVYLKIKKQHSLGVNCHLLATVQRT